MPHTRGRDWAVEMPEVLNWLREDVASRGVHGVWGRAAQRFGTSRDTIRQAVTSDRWHSEWQAITGQAGSAVLTGTAGQSSSPVLGTAPTCSPEEYVRGKKRADCRVCHLHPDTLVALKRCADRGLKVAEQLEWLRAACGVAVTPQEIAAHRSQGHEQ